MITSMTFFANASNGGWGLQFIKDSTDSVILDEVPAEIKSAFQEILKYCLSFKTENEAAAYELLKKLEPTLTDEDRLSYASLYPEWNSLERYESGALVRFDGELFRMTGEEPKVRARRSLDGASNIAEKKNPKVRPGIWTKLGPPEPEINWEPQNDYSEGYKEGDRVRFPDGILRVSKINGNRYSPESMPEVWEEV